jgi:hypothetical protein
MGAKEVLSNVWLKLYQCFDKKKALQTYVMGVLSCQQARVRMVWPA